ncbi:MAG: hypothetical protein RMY64_06990 [Nostoc sp. DedQUE08]|uniref:hypothetical protein n=1 Tax=Nostoc sp. DedQUE08 TaxID=3075393 RepID=UPI002AD3062B|nr:hypothetical protein [Nostoc sp. DedQUE08]MDZ8065372.1 hypothetical protein [Nostoc sp. DedQUE08]
MKKLWHLPFQGHDNWKSGTMFEDKPFSICIVVLFKYGDRFVILLGLRLKNKNV